MSCYTIPDMGKEDGNKYRQRERERETYGDGAVALGKDIS